MDDWIKGKTALVTGAARRIGREIALALAHAGANVVIHYHRSDQAANELCQKVRALGVRADILRADLGDDGQALTLMERAISAAGPVDILINNASIFREETLWETSTKSLAQNMQVHALSPLILARAFAQQGCGGHIVNLLDTRMLVYDRQYAAYHISKRALLTLTRMLAQELGPEIAVNAVAPGLILPPAGQDESYLDELTYTNPLKRHGDPKDVTDAVEFLLRSRFITGQVIYVDGGYHMKGHMYD